MIKLECKGMLWLNENEIGIWIMKLEGLVTMVYKVEMA